jgi:hypothetical protein
MPWFLGLVLTTAALGCGNPCDDLVNRICGCNPNDTAVTACKNRVSSDTLFTSTTSAQKDTCSKVLDNCTCSALACGNYAACGLANDTTGIIDGSQRCN